MREFGQLESAVMDVIWAQDRPCLVREVREQLSYDRPLAYTTVMTVLTILYGKGVLCRERAGRAWQYWPAERREEHDARLMTEILQSGGDRRATLRRFLDRISDEDMTLLRTAVDSHQVAASDAAGSGMQTAGAGRTGPRSASCHTRADSTMSDRPFASEGSAARTLAV